MISNWALAAQVVEAAARVGHLAAWRCFLAGAGLLEEGELPPRQQLQLGLSPQVGVLRYAMLSMAGTTAPSHQSISTAPALPCCATGIR